MSKIQAYLMRVDEQTGQVFKGYLSEIENTLKAKQDYVNYGHPNGLIQVISLGDIDIICNDEGKLLQYPPNRVILDDDNTVLDIFCGSIMALRHDDSGEFTSILPSDIPVIDKYIKPLYKTKSGIGIVIPTERWLEEYKED